jgi:hypothetical protein
MRFLSRLGPYLLPGTFIGLALLLVLIPIVDADAYARLTRRLSEAVPRLLAWTTWWPIVTMVVLSAVLQHCGRIARLDSRQRAARRWSLLTGICLSVLVTLVTAWTTWLRLSGQAPSPILDNHGDLGLVWLVISILWMSVVIYQIQSLSPVWFGVPLLRAFMRRRLTASLQGIDNDHATHAIVLEHHWESVPAIIDLIDHRDAHDAALVAALRAALRTPGLPDVAHAQLFSAIARMGMPPDDRPGLVLAPAP